MATPIVQTTSFSTLTDRYQTTVPNDVRKFLGLQKRDKLRFTIQSNGDVVVSKYIESEAEDDHEDLVLKSFLDFLEKDIQDNPHRLQPLDQDLFSRWQSLAKEISLAEDIDIDAPLEDDDDDIDENDLVDDSGDKDFVDSPLLNTKSNNSN